MTERTFRLTIPIERWATERFVPAAAGEALVVGAQLTDGTTTVDELVVRRRAAVLNPVAFDVSATLRWNSGSRSFATSIDVEIAVRDPHQRRTAEITVRTTSRWRSRDPLDVLSDTAETLAISFGGLEPIHRAALALESALAMIDIHAEVWPSPTLARNRDAVLYTAEQPPMSSDAASPLNPYALEGIPGVEAEQWADRGFPATEAAPWASNGFDAMTASAWASEEFTADDAAAWVLAGAEVEDAAACRDDGIPPEHLADAASSGVLPYEFVAMHGVVPVSEMGAWINVIEDHDLIEALDVRTLVGAGLSANDVAHAPEDLTALEIIRYLSGEFDPDDVDVDDDW